MRTYIIIKPRSASSRVLLNLVKDSGGKVLQKNILGLEVACKKSVANSLGLIELVHVESVSK
jgi:hypothetical protein